AVEQRDHLRHRGHLHDARPVEARGAADDQAGGGHDQAGRPIALELDVEERRRDREEHAGRRDAVAVHRGLRPRQALQPEDERHRRDEIGERDERAQVHYFRCPGFCLNIASIRSVTTKPPTTFAAPSTTAKNPSARPSGPPIAADTSIAPLTVIPWIA